MSERGYGGEGSAPVEEGKEYEIEIIDISRRGEGVAKIEGFVIFVPGTKLGQRLKIRITRIGRNYAAAEAVG